MRQKRKSNLPAMANPSLKYRAIRALILAGRRLMR